MRGEWIRFSRGGEGALKVTFVTVGMVVVLVLWIVMSMNKPAIAVVDGREVPLACPDDFYVTSAVLAGAPETQYGKTAAEATNPFSPDQRLPSGATALDQSSSLFSTNSANPDVVYMVVKTDVGYVVDTLVWCGLGENDDPPEEIRGAFGR